MAWHRSRPRLCFYPLSSQFCPALCKSQNPLQNGQCPTTSLPYTPGNNGNIKAASLWVVVVAQGLRRSIALSSPLPPGFSLHASQAESEKGGLVGFVRAAAGRDVPGAREKGVRGRRGQEGPQGGAGLQT